MQFTCKNCGFLNEVKPIYNKEQEETAEKLKVLVDEETARIEKQRAEYDRIDKVCEKANKEWKDNPKKNEFFKSLFGTNLGYFNKFVTDNYSELVELNKKKMVSIYNSLETVNPSPSLLPSPNLDLLKKYIEAEWNYSYTCQYCSRINKFWRKKDAT